MPISDDEDAADNIIAMIPVAVSCVQQNQGLFDDDGWMSTPLLEPSRKPIYAVYRYAYAEMLHMWGQPLARLEIMKFNVLKEDILSSSTTFGSAAGDSSHHESYIATDAISHNAAHGTDTTSPTTIPLGGRKEQLQALLASSRGLDVTGICRIHEIQLDPLEYSQPTDGVVGGAVGICHRCHSPRNGSGPCIPQTHLICVYCCEPIVALYPPCLGCGCASHEECLAEWHAMGETECPAGDECDCTRDASNGQVESWPALQAAVMARMRSSPVAKSGGALRKLMSFGEGRVDRRRSVPARFGPKAHLIEEDDEDLYDDGQEDGGEKEDWQSVPSSHEIPPHSRSRLSDKLQLRADGPVSAARISLGNRLRKATGRDLSARSSTGRTKSIGVAPWKKNVI
jgi:hypothetical protein